MSQVFRSIDLDETAENVQLGPTDLLCIHAINVATAPRYLKLYDSLAPTVGTTTPKMTLAIPSQGSANGAGFTINFGGIRFSTGLVAAVTTGVADSDTGATAANSVIVNIEYN